MVAMDAGANDMNPSSVRRPLNGPNRRWNVAWEWFEAGLHVARPTDQLVGDALDFIRVKHGEDMAVVGVTAQTMPAIAMALEIRRDWDLSCRMERLVLAGVDDAKIAAYAGMDAAIVTIWRQLFFEIGDLRSMVEWLAQYVLSPGPHMGDEGHVKKLQLALKEGPEATLKALRLEDQQSTYRSSPPTAGSTRRGPHGGRQRSKKLRSTTELKN